jgi:hypothetical protein
MTKRYKVCVIDEAAEKQQCIDIETNGMPMEALTSTISAMLAVFTRLFGVKAKEPAAD